MFAGKGKTRRVKFVIYVRKKFYTIGPQLVNELARLAQTWKMNLSQGRYETPKTEKLTETKIWRGGIDKKILLRKT